MAETTNFLTFKKKLLKLAFERSFLFWLILASLELIFPGMVIHYVNLNWWLLIICCLAVLNVL